MAAFVSSVALLFTLPLATLEITLPPALMPAILSIDKPPTVTLSVVMPVPVMAVVPFVKPEVLITVLPAVKDVPVKVVPVNALPTTEPSAPFNVITLALDPTVTLLFAVTESTVISFLVATVIFFLSVLSCVITILSPFTRFTVSPPFTVVLSVVLELVVRFQAAPALAASAALLIASATFLAVAKPSAPVTEAAPLLASLSIWARLVETSTVLPFILVEMKSPVAPFTLKATSVVDKDWLDFAPESAPREIFRASAVVFAAILVVLVAILPLLVAISVVFAAILFLLVAISAAFVAILDLLAATPVALVLI